jgi:hypothetical protein
LLHILRNLCPNNAKESSIFLSNSDSKESDILINQVLDQINETKEIKNNIKKTDEIESCNLLQLQVLHEKSEITYDNLT